MNEIVSLMITLQYAVYEDVLKPNTIARINTMDRKNVFNTGLEVGRRKMFICLYFLFFLL